MTEMTLEQLQDRVWSMVESCDMGTSIDERLSKLLVEVRELHAEMLWKFYFRQSVLHDVASIAKEIADVQITLLALAKSLEITNPTEITLAKIEDTEERYGRKGND